MKSSRKVQLIKVNQWLPSWDRVQWREGLEKPKGNFYVGSIPLQELRELAAVTTRDIKQRSNPNAIHGYQRLHEEARSKKISKYVHFGYPLSTSPGLDPDEHEHLINPGWLPNAIIVNVIPSGEKRIKNGEEVPVPSELEVKIDESEGFCQLEYPNSESISEFRKTKRLFTEPVEIIDGQHRLFASDYGKEFGPDYEVPIVVFDNLSLGWQAYLFWTINVEPKKINASLAFDLYPELRRQEWLEQSETIRIYQEHRSQEMSEALWSHPLSPWHERIELHGRRQRGHVSNAAFIRSLNSSFIKKWNSGEKVGGLFGSIPKKDGSAARVIPWKRSQQAAFLVTLWRSVCKAVENSSAEWKISISKNEQRNLINDLPPAFAGENTLLATDQGVRAIHNIFNAIFQDIPGELELEAWNSNEEILESPTEESINIAIDSFARMKKANRALDQISEVLINNFDWRLSSAPGLEENEKKIQSAYRGSGGYSMMMRELLEVLSVSDSLSAEVKKAAKDVSATLIKN